MTLLAFLVVLGPLVFFHELGHFVMAKLAGVRVEEFGFGFPPRLFKFWTSPSRLTVNGVEVRTRSNVALNPRLAVGKPVEVLADQEEEGVYRLRQVRVLDPEVDDVTPRREAQADGLVLRGELTGLERGTEYTFNLLLMGAFVRMTGEEDPSDPLSLAAQPKRWRTAVLLGGPVMNLIVAVLFFAATFVVGGYNEFSDPYAVIAGVAPGSPAAEAGLEPGDVILRAGDQPIDDMETWRRYLQSSADRSVSLTVERDGEVWQLPASLSPGSDGEADGFGATLAEAVIVYVASDSPAQQAGIQVNDVVLQANGLPMGDISELIEYIEAHTGQDVRLTLSRAGRTMTFAVYAREDPPAGQGYMGIALREEWVTERRVDLGEALGMGFLQLVDSVGQLVTLPAQLLRQEVTAEQVRPVGPVGISQLAGQAIEASQEEDNPSIILGFAGIISMALGTTNLLPLPALDGGRLVFVFIEAIRGRRVSPDKEGIIHFVGLALMLVLLLVMTVYELGNPVQLP